MKGKILDAFYDEEYHVSGVEKQTKWGTFFASTLAQECDLDIANEWDGQRFAEIKTDMMALKAKWKVMRERAKGVETAYNNLAQAHDENDPIMKALYRQVMAARKEAKGLKYRYDKMVENYPKLTDIVLDTRRDMRKKQEAKANFLNKLEETTD